nr:2'-5' RNA ligase family protein [Saccharomonospora viridis]
MSTLEEATTMSGGHSVIVVPVPELEDYITSRTAHYDASFLSSDPAFVHAHITLLGPWLAEPSQTDLDAVAAIMAAAEPFETTLSRIETFPDGLIYLRPEPDEPFRALTAALVNAFPHCPPYEGRFPNPVPHLTLDRRAETITPESVEADLRHLLPVRLRVDRVDLQWWANHDCHVRESWKLGKRR